MHIVNMNLLHSSQYMYTEYKTLEAWTYLYGVFLSTDNLGPLSAFSSLDILLGQVYVSNDMMRMSRGLHFLGGELSL